MAAKFIFIAGALGIASYAGHQMANYDPTIFPYSKIQAQNMLVAAKTKLPRRDGPGEIKIWSEGRSYKGVSLAMRYAEWAPLLECEAVITEIAPDKSRVVPDCGGSPDSSSAIATTTANLRVPMFAEFIQSTLEKREFNRANATRQETAAVLGNIGGMNREALKRSDEAQRMAAEASH